MIKILFICHGSRQSSMKIAQKTVDKQKKLCYDYQAFNHGLLVKRSRRRPLTA